MKEKETTSIDMKKLLPLVIIFLLLFALIIFLKLYSQKDSSQRSSDEGRIPDQVEITNYEDVLPVNYPKDLPQYGKAEIASASASDSSVSVMWRTEDSIEEVKSYYDLELKNHDWEYELTETDEAVMYKLDKNGKTGFMVIASENGITTITVAVGLE